MRYLDNVSYAQILALFSNPIRWPDSFENLRVHNERIRKSPVVLTSRFYDLCLSFPSIRGLVLEGTLGFELSAMIFSKKLFHIYFNLG